MHHHCPGVPCLIVGTQTDLREDPSVKEKLAKQRMQPVRKEDGEKMARELGAVKYVECSALTQYKLKDVFDEVFHVSLSLSVCSILRFRLTNHFFRKAIVAALEPPPKTKGGKEGGKRHRLCAIL